MSGNTTNNGNSDHVSMPLIDQLDPSQELHLQLTPTQPGNNDTSISGEEQVISLFDISGDKDPSDINNVAINSIDTHRLSIFILTILN